MTEKDLKKGKIIHKRKTLPPRMYISDIHRLIKDAERCQSWSQLAAIDISRQKLFSYKPIWCADFSEIRVFIEKNEAHATALHLIDHFASSNDSDLDDETLVLLPGTIFEILTYLENLIKDRKSTLSITDEFKKSIKYLDDPVQIGEHIISFIRKHGDVKIEEAIDLLERTEPSVLRLRTFLSSKRVKFFHSYYSANTEELLWFPGYFDKMYQELHSRRDQLTINNYNDALNMAICHSMNEKHLRDKLSYFVYVTRDRACMEAAMQNSWLGDPMREVDPSEIIPLCREPYSVFLYLGEKKGKKDLADTLYLNCRDFVTQLKRVPEYLQAVKERRLKEGEQGYKPVIYFYTDDNTAHRTLSNSLEKLLNNYGTLIYRAIEESDFEELGKEEFDRPKRLRIGDFPKRELIIGTRSLEKLSAALGLVYKEIISEKDSADRFINKLLRVEKAEYSITMSKMTDADFMSTAYTLTTTIGRESVVCIIETYNAGESEEFYFSAWWNSVANLSQFVDAANYFWSRVRQDNLKSSDPPVQSEIAAEKKKVFDTGFMYALQAIIDGQITDQIIVERIPDLMPIRDTIDRLRANVAKYTPYSLRINTWMGDFWLNIKPLADSPPRMGIISHIWNPKVLAEIIAYTSKHYVSVNDVESKLQGIKI